MASGPLVAQATTSMSASWWMIAVKPARTTTWSSTQRIRIISSCRSNAGIIHRRRRNGCFNLSSFVRATGQLEAATQPFRTLSHADQSPALASGEYVFGNRESAAVVGHSHFQEMKSVGELDTNVRRFSMSNGISDGLLCNAKELQLHVARKSLGHSTDDHLQPGIRVAQEILARLT